MKIQSLKKQNKLLCPFPLSQYLLLEIDVEWCPFHVCGSAVPSDSSAEEGSAFSHTGLHVREAGVGVGWRQRLSWAPLALPLTDRKSRQRAVRAPGVSCCRGWCRVVEVRPDAPCRPEGETYKEVSDTWQVFVMGL